MSRSVLHRRDHPTIVREVTGGWQGNQGGGYGGDWQPQQDPYGQQQYGPPYDPYGQYQQQDPYAAQGYPGYDPGFGQGPPKKSKLPIVLSIVAIAAVVGATVTIILLNRDDSSPSAGPVANSSSAAKPPSSPSKPPSTSRRPPTSGTASKPTPKDGWTTISLTDGTGTYQVPADWKKSTEKKDSGLGVQFADVTESGVYDCAGHSYFRGFAASSEVQGKDGAELDLNKAVTDFANSFAGKYYNSPKIDLPTPKETTVSGKKAATATAKLTVTPLNPECEATSGEVAVTGAAIEKSGKIVGVRLLVVVNDLEGGPATPKPLPDPLAEEILETLSLN